MPKTGIFSDVAHPQNIAKDLRAVKVLGADTLTDIAVLRVEAKDLPVVRLGNSLQLQVGDPVLAIGAPFGFEQSATQGIVSV
jgi:serine protease Do